MQDNEKDQKHVIRPENSAAKLSITSILFYYILKQFDKKKLISQRAEFEKNLQEQMEKILAEYWALKTDNNLNCQIKSSRSSDSKLIIRNPFAPTTLTTLKTKILPHTFNGGSINHTKDPHPPT